MKFYTNVVHHKGQFLFRGYENGKRVYYKDRTYKPYIFVKAKDEETDFRTLDGTNVEKMSFDSTWEARQFMQKYEGISGFDLYGMTNWVYPYIYDNYGINIQHNHEWVRVANLDIETRSDEGFPRPEEATKKVTAITVRFRKVAYVFGVHSYNPEKLRKQHNIEPAKNVRYVECADERDMLIKFLNFWQRLDPDIVTGWNVNGFDIPYMINRIARILGEEQAKKMSPWGMIEWREVEVMGRMQKFATLVGITILDYLEMYKKFCPGSRESFKLDYIGKYEKCEVTKFDYEELGYKDLHDLYTRNYDLYIHYNIIDTEVVDNLEEKLKLIRLVIVMSYNSGLNYQDAMTTVRLWDVTIHGYLMSKGIVIPQPKSRAMTSGGIEGAYVKDPVVGMSRWVCSFDVNSLYPSLIRQCNISPETLVTTLTSVTVDSMLNADPTYKDMIRADGQKRVGEDLLSRLKDNTATLCATGCIFDTSYQGFYPYLMEFYYGERTRYKNLLKDAKKRLEALERIGNPSAEQIAAMEEIGREVATYDMFQYSFKIMLNSAYGALTNAAYRWFDPRLGESVTKTGQLTIRWVERDINANLNKLLGTVDEKFVIYCDTDSAYVRLEKFVDRHCVGMTDEQTVDYVDTFCKTVIEPIIEKSFKRFTETFNHRENVLVMKREAIANKGIWTNKKRYILNVWDMEGFRYPQPQLKMQGIEAVKSSTPRAARDTIKAALSIIMNKDERAFTAFLKAEREKFSELEFDDVAYPRSCNNLLKYTDHSTIYKSGCPIHVRGALVFNHYVKTMKLENEIKTIEEGDKIKFCRLHMPNPIMEEVIATTGDMPKKLGLREYVDYKSQFERGVISPLQAIADAIGWNVEDYPSLEDLFIED